MWSSARRSDGLANNEFYLFLPVFGLHSCRRREIDLFRRDVTREGPSINRRKEEER